MFSLSWLVFRHEFVRCPWPVPIRIRVPVRYQDYFFDFRCVLILAVCAAGHPSRRPRLRCRRGRGPARRGRGAMTRGHVGCLAGPGRTQGPLPTVPTRLVRAVRSAAYSHHTLNSAIPYSLPTWDTHILSLVSEHVGGTGHQFVRI